MTRNQAFRTALAATSLLAALQPAMAAAHPDMQGAPVGSQQRALMLRSQGLDQRYGLGASSVRVDLRSPDTRDATAPTPPSFVTVASPSAGQDFDWGAAGLGATLTASAGVLAAAAAIATRRRPRGLHA